MKGNSIAPLFLSATVLLTFTASAQLDRGDWNQIGGSLGGVPKKESPAEAARRIHNARMQFAHGQIYRIFNGQTYNVVKSQKWKWVGGKIYQKQDGILILEIQRPARARVFDNGTEVYSERQSTFYAVTNFSTFNGEIVAGKSIDELGVRIGTYDFDGAPIAFYDLGKPYVPTPAEIAAAKAKQEQAARMESARVHQAQANAVRWLQPQATNGDASAQCSLGEHYLNGIGCETNRELGIYWLKKAAAQGDFEASNVLTRLQR